MAKSSKAFKTPLLRSLTLSDVTVTEEKLGARGTVSKGTWGGAVCALKRLDLSQPSANLGQVAERLEKECKTLCDIRHPNIVQFFGVLLEGDTVPVMVYDYCPLSVAAVLDAHPKLPLHLQLSVLRDVTQGLNYLHAIHNPPIVHGRLTANNVLVSPSLQAKISDLGVAHILNSNKTLKTSAYLPPEINKASKPKYAPPVDVFSFGNLILHVSSHKWPIPTEPVKGVKSSLAEVERRREHIDLMGSSHPLAKQVQQCLHSDPDHRPKAGALVIQLTELAEKDRSQYNTTLDLLIGMERRESELLHTAEDLTQHKKKLQEVTLQLGERNNELAILRDQVKTLEEELANKHPMQGIIRPPGVKELQDSTSSTNEEAIAIKPTQASFVWKRDAPMPIGMQSATAVLLDGKLYIGGGETKELQQDRLVYEYDFDGLVRKWTCLPPTPTVYFSLVVFNKSLVLVGGADISSRRSTAQIFTWDKNSQEWLPSLPPMPTARQKSAAVSHNMMLLVGGGYSNKRCVSAVECLDSSNFQWQTLKSLPVPASGLTSCVVHDHWYLLGGKLYGETGSLTSLLCLDLSGDIAHNSWSVLPDAPLTSSCAVASEHMLLAVGGAYPGSSTPNKAIHVYLPSAQRWMLLCEMPTAHSFTAAVVASAGKLYIAGGKEESLRMITHGTTVDVLCV